ncbi:MAG: bifunctional phosphoribosylaminoimidazolecarboxamide formyltransferase/IMP cyclohydrolase [Phycisphaeraceae bacterium]|nr:bifunctional phosphoribosylaminoimidazolecarboxamide formyltransferase/IMP cyclohydrolase [Phycisphaeraceae bacterium]
MRRALLSVSDKSGLATFARALAAHGAELLSTGGTAEVLRRDGLEVVSIEQLAGVAEMLDGRVKTLQPAVHAGILARRDDPRHMDALREAGIAPIDLVCVNLYPFERTIAGAGVTREEAIEQIDVGGPAMIRAAAKNAEYVVVVTSPSQYDLIIAELESSEGGVGEPLRRALASAAFARTAAYDAHIATYLQAEPTDAFPRTLVLHAERAMSLRYGENPHQSAALYRMPGDTGPSIARATQHHGKELGYNNIADADAALALVAALHRLDPSAVGACVVKHGNPCGCGAAASGTTAVSLALDGDPLAAYGGVFAANRPLDAPMAERLCADDAFLEVVVAPGFEGAALDRLRSRWKNVRLLEVGRSERSSSRRIGLRSIHGGLLMQTLDVQAPKPSDWVHRAGPKPTSDQLRTGAFLEVVGGALLSNAVCIGRNDGDGPTLAGAGAGQMDRVTACRLAVEKAGQRARGAVAYSDAFFPFSDGPQTLIDAGVSMIVHPGGAKRDDATFEACGRAGVCCVTTGFRRFRH